MYFLSDDNVAGIFLKKNHQPLMCCCLQMRIAAHESKYRNSSAAPLPSKTIFGLVSVKTKFVRETYRFIFSVKTCFLCKSGQSEIFFLVKANF